MTDWREGWPNRPFGKCRVCAVVVVTETEEAFGKVAKLSEEAVGVE